MKNQVLMILIACSLSACTTLEVAHAPVDCLGQPGVSVNLTQEEYDATQASVLQKFSYYAKVLRARIDAQCKINYAHDEIHGEDK